MTKFKKVLLIILDGFGVASASPGNAITRAKMRAFNSLVNHFPSITLQAAGPNVGLSWGESGNSEVGHMCLGAGRIVLQNLPRIDRSIASGEYYTNPAFLSAVEHVKKYDSTLHLVGLLGDGNVHASQLHLYSLLTLAAVKGLQKVNVHVITDGRDTAPDAGMEFLRSLEKKMIEIGIGKIATLSGRFYAMDRAQHWDLTEAAYKAMALGTGELAASPQQALQGYYGQNIFDETVPPTVIADPVTGKPATMQPKDAMIFYNFRTDRAVQLTQAFLDPARTGMVGQYPKLEELLVVTMTEYSKDLTGAQVAFPRLSVSNTLPEVIAAHHKRQYHISETEKFPHVTYFFSNGHEQPNENEVWDKVSSHSSYQQLYENVPQMSAAELTKRLLAKLSEPIEFFLVNFANPDMVGHTGSLSASVQAVETVDMCLEQLVKHAMAVKDLAVLITSDHGNVEHIHDVQTGRIRKAHTTNPVPLILAGDGLRLPQPRTDGYLFLPTQIPGGLLSDIAPTVLDIFEIPKVPEMTGISLLPILLKQLGSN
ncbi:MAG: 2,3-bisphosphoglycerate-independent phosphoglycerate mutase [Patescibacteria group bacterium]|nr:2,3-bisphosphoglycerate-independent phosphoglycerate mutase [Patescibacteria group bacterium]